MPLKSRLSPSPSPPSTGRRRGSSWLCLHDPDVTGATVHFQNKQSARSVCEGRSLSMRVFLNHSRPAGCICVSAEPLLLLLGECEGEQNWGSRRGGKFFPRCHCDCTSIRTTQCALLSTPTGSLFTLATVSPSIFSPISLTPNLQGKGWPIDWETEDSCSWLLKR